jgi:hypothetical protein
MRAVEIKVHPADLAARMAAMRFWLDEHRVEPSSFASRRKGEEILICVAFNTDEHAGAFSARFNGGDAA